jgi:hypothetical protein
MTFLSPRLRSRPFGHRHLTAGSIVSIGLITWIVPPILMIVLGLPFIFIGEAVGNQNLQGIGVISGLGIAALGVGIFAVPVALLLGAWFLRFGYAGWGAALAAGCVLPTGFGVIFQILDPTTAAIGPMLLFTPIVLLHAAVLWAATRHFCPAALLE